MKDPNFIIQTVADYCGISLDDIVSTSQKTDYRKPRQIAMFLMQKYNDFLSQKNQALSIP